ncbi:LuxR C-terminal-related transcriptional regulator [Lentzea sp. NPDC051838]|uniref:ATP-binding protein n=1 Tax=Lentzea sp. NPDC051838 TaxID=3154849 RepID=UPI003412988B
MYQADRRCPMCGAALAASGRRYCSNACRQLAYRTRRSPGGEPVRPDGFVGRHNELSQVQQAFEVYRLVTLTGPGGVGKTRLGREALRHITGSRAAPVVEVDLAVVAGDDRLVAQSFAAALGLPERHGMTLVESMIDALNKSRVLLFVDNCEHVVEPCAVLVDTLLRRCPRLRVLTTSREVLDVTGEFVLRLGGLPVPESVAPGALKGSDAVRLFVDRAEGFELTQENAPHVVAVCTALDGNPLAIELAARQIPALAVEAVHERLVDRFDLIAGRDTAPRRQRSLSDAISWSYELLSPAERTALARLSVLTGQFDLETATAVCADETLPADEVLGLVRRLQSTSLLVSGADTGTYRLLETIRRYGKERLREKGETDATWDRLATWLAGLLELCVEQPVWFPMETHRRLVAQADNLYAAARHATGDVDRQTVLSIAIVRIWMFQGQFAESQEYLRAALARTASPRLRCVLLGYAGCLSTLQGDLAAATSAMEECLAIGQAADDVPSLLDGHYTMAFVQVANQRLDVATRHYAEALALARGLDDAEAVAMVLDRMAWKALVEGNLDEAERLVRQALPVFLQPSPPHGAGFALHNAGSIALARGDADEAEKHFRTALTVVTPDSIEVSFVLDGLGMVAARRDEPKPAMRFFLAAASMRGLRFFNEPTWRRQVATSFSDARRTVGQSGADDITEEMVDLVCEDMITLALHAADTGTGEPLDDDERAIVTLTLAGLTNRQIALRRGISPSTVSARLRSIRGKLAVDSRAEIAAWAQENIASQSPLSQAM